MLWCLFLCGWFILPMKTAIIGSPWKCPAIKTVSFLQVLICTSIDLVLPWILVEEESSSLYLPLLDSTLLIREIHCTVHGWLNSSWLCIKDFNRPLSRCISEKKVHQRGLHGDPAWWSGCLWHWNHHCVVSAIHCHLYETHYTSWCFCELLLLLVRTVILLVHCTIKIIIVVKILC